MLHSRSNRETDIVVYVTYSRFRKILSDIRALKGLEVEGFIDQVCKDYNYFGFYSSDIGDSNRNHYIVVKIHDYDDEPYGKCKVCDCSYKRYINGATGLCYYKEYIMSNYTTKIPKQ